MLYLFASGTCGRKVLTVCRAHSRGAKEQDQRKTHLGKRGPCDLASGELARRDLVDEVEKRVADLRGRLPRSGRVDGRGLVRSEVVLLDEVAYPVRGALSRFAGGRVGAPAELDEQLRAVRAEAFRVQWKPHPAPLCDHGSDDVLLVLVEVHARDHVGAARKGPLQASDLRELALERVRRDL
jgi:hypothetical protein